MIGAFDRRTVLIAIGKLRVAVRTCVGRDINLAIDVIDRERREGACRYRNRLAVLGGVNWAQAKSLHFNHIHLLKYPKVVSRGGCPFRSPRLHFHGRSGRADNVPAAGPPFSLPSQIPTATLTALRSRMSALRR